MVRALPGGTGGDTTDEPQPVPEVEPDSGAGFTSPDEVSGEGGYDGDAGGGVNEPEPEPQEPAPDNTTGLGGSHGDPVTSPQNQPDDQDTTAPPDSTTGLGGSQGDPVPNEENRPDYTSPEDDSPWGLGVGYMGFPSDPDEDLADAVEDASENSPVVDDITDDEFTDIQEDHGANPDLPSDVADAVTDAAPNVPNVEAPDVDVPGLQNIGTWLKVAVVAVLGFAFLWLVRPLFQIGAGVTGE